MNNYLTQETELKAAINHYKNSKILWLDTEVADYQTKKPRLSLISISDDPTDLNGSNVSVLDVLNYPKIVKLFIEEIMLNPNLKKVFHNASYDLQFLGKKQAENVICTLEIVQNLPYYLVPLKNHQLKTLAEVLCNFTNVDKSEQSGDWGQRPLTEKQLIYAKMDVVYLAHIYQRLLQLSKFIEPNPETEDLDALMLRYRQIEHRWKELDSEMENLKKRLKNAMNIQKVLEKNGFKLSSYQKTTKKVSFKDLAQIVQETGLDLDLVVTLTKDTQQQLEEVMEYLPIEEAITTVSTLKVAEIDEEDLPF
jgi:ribonuclease D